MCGLIKFSEVLKIFSFIYSFFVGEDFPYIIIVAVVLALLAVIIIAAICAR